MVFVLLFVGRLGNISFPIYVMARRGKAGTFFFGTSSINLNIINYPNINFQQDINEESNFQCLTAELNNSTMKIDVTITDCLEKHTIICQKIRFVKPNCVDSNSVRIENRNPFSILLDPAKNRLYKLSIAYKRAEMAYVLKWLDQSAAYQSIFKTVWYSGVNFINILRTNFSYERCFGSFFLVTCTYMYVEKAAETTFVKKCALIMLMKLTVGSIGRSPILGT